MSEARVSPEATIVVVGAGLAGGRTCVALRQLGHRGPVILIGAEEHLPYDRPPLSKAVLASGADPGLGLELDGVDVRLGVRATGLDLAATTLTTDAGEVSYDVLVLATGAEPVRLPGEGRQVSLRTREDATLIRAELRPGSRVVLVGAGWIGAEVATAAVAAGCRVTCLEGGAAPLAGPLGAEVAARFLPWWREVDLRTGVQVEEITADGVRLRDQTLAPADLVVTGVGVRPAVGWLAESGLELAGGGVAVDGDGRTSDPAVFAVGDVAARWSPRLGARVHAGHWDEAVNGASAVAQTIVGAAAGADRVPYFWSDQFGRKVQYVGQHGPADRAVLREHDDPEKWGVAWLAEDGRLTAHLNVGYPKAMVQARVAVEEQRRVDDEAVRRLDAAL